MLTVHKLLVRWGFGLLLVVLLAACDQQAISELEEGVSTEADVRERYSLQQGEAAYRRLLFGD